jgi:hypothetical protein
MIAQSAQLQACIVDCLECYSVCRQEAMNRLQAGGRHTDADHVRLMQDCAEVCRTTADLMLGGSTFCAAMCMLCADVCEACARSCEEIGGLDGCATVCRGCAQSCRSVGATAPSALAA